MKKNLLIITVLFLSFNIAKAQQVVKGNGTTFSTFLLGNTAYAAKSQSIFLPSDFANLAGGDITRVYYKYGTDTTAQTLTRFSIEIGQTTDLSFTANNFFTGLTPVFYSDSYTIAGGIAGQWFSIDLDTPFAYDSTKTLIVQIVFPVSAVEVWGTLGTNNNPVKKLVSPDTLAITGSPSSGTWQDFGFDLATPTGTKSFISKATGFDFMMSPNPASNNLQITIFNSSSVQLQIINSIGETVVEKTINQNTTNIDLSGLSDGIYFANIKDQTGKLKSKKFVVKK